MKTLCILIIGLTSLSLSAQNLMNCKNYSDTTWQGHFGINIGTSTMKGYSLQIDYGMCKELNVLKLSVGLESEIGNSFRGIFGPAFLNDKFYHLDFLFGRVIQYNRFVTEIDAGLYGYAYKDKSYTEHNGYLTTYTTNSTSERGIGFTSRLSTGIQLSKKDFLGFEGIIYWNPDIIIASVGLRWKVLF